MNSEVGDLEQRYMPRGKKAAPPKNPRPREEKMSANISQEGAPIFYGYKILQVEGDGPRNGDKFGTNLRRASPTFIQQPPEGFVWALYEATKPPRKVHHRVGDVYIGWIRDPHATAAHG
jgi:hypothetical protein